jgi:hypothetical protein
VKYTFRLLGSDYTECIKVWSHCRGLCARHVNSVSNYKLTVLFQLIQRGSHKLRIGGRRQIQCAFGLRIWGAHITLLSAFTLILFTLASATTSTLNLHNVHRHICRSWTQRTQVATPTRQAYASRNSWTRIPCHGTYETKSRKSTIFSNLDLKLSTPKLSSVLTTDILVI